MKSTFYDRLVRREIGDRYASSKIGGIYGDRRWIKDLDIVNELDGHTGCVNALSWSKNGELLASGSDDTHILLHSYQPNDSTSPFKLRTSIATGHEANIFSVKFMPHSSDRTVISAAGDSQIRVFDIEYAGQSTQSTATTSSSRARRFLNSGIQYLSEADTNARVYRSHSDRVKKIVTESSPFLFLSCSEDGEVRQWDLRLPSSAYPKPRGGRYLRTSGRDDDAGVPPPLITYKRFGLDINSISCSPSQPHYIALGGAHLHCFLHDRRMLGRDRVFERAASASRNNNNVAEDDDAMCEATQCVKRFAPNGQQRMKRTDNGHITACKISDANPNEMVVSWSGEWIYNFNLLRTPDARDLDPSGGRQQGHKSQRARHSRDLKRKRNNEQVSSPLSTEGAQRAESRPRQSREAENEESREVSLRVRYENGQSENIRIEDNPGSSTQPSHQESLAIPMSEAQMKSRRLADTFVKIRKHMFTLGEAKATSTRDPTGHAISFTSVLGFCAAIIDDMDEVMRAWRYPVDPDEFDLALQKTLRRRRESARRFIQSSGVLARVMGGRIHTAGGNEGRLLDAFAKVIPAPNELPLLDSPEHFCHEFLKAICLWLDSGPGAVVEGFTKPKDRYRMSSRFPIPEGAGIEALDEILIPYLLDLAGSRPIIDVSTSRFELDQNRQIFDSERKAVIAFSHTLKIPFEDLSSAVVLAPPNETSTSRIERMAAQDRKTALKYWAFRVGRGILLNAGEGVNHASIDRAFGGLGKSPVDVRREERKLDERLKDIDVEETDPLISDTHTSGTRVRTSDDTNAAEQDSDDEMVPIEDFRAALAEAAAAAEQDDDNDDDEDGEDNGDDDAENSDDADDVQVLEDDDEGDDDGEEGVMRRFLYRSAFERSVMREKVKTSVPCVSHTRYYRGHCNIRTVKDVNFFGLDDEYVVSGCDSGHLFIWDRQTTQLVNILEGDGETVNVIQGHPYEPMLAVSGIDHTIKIFSPDRCARRDARKGIGVAAADPAGWSSLNFGRRRGFGLRRRRQAQQPVTSEPAVPAKVAEGVDSEDTDTEPPAASTGLSSKKRMHEEYQITSQNDEDRQGGNREGIISRAMLAQVAAQVQATRNGGGGGGGGEEDDGEGVQMVIMGPSGPVVVNADNCTIM